LPEREISLRERGRGRRVNGTDRVDSGEERRRIKDGWEGSTFFIDSLSA
jgi:hypothetical protein